MEKSDAKYWLLSLTYRLPWSMMNENFFTVENYPKKKRKKNLTDEIKNRKTQTSKETKKKQVHYIWSCFFSFIHVVLFCLWFTTIISMCDEFKFSFNIYNFQLDDHHHITDSIAYVIWSSSSSSYVL